MAVYSVGGSSQFHLSGISQSQTSPQRSCPSHLVIEDQERAYVGMASTLSNIPRKLKIFSQRTDGEFPVPGQHNHKGYFVHSRCWTLAHGVLGPRIQAELGLFLDCLTEYFGAREPTPNPHNQELLADPGGALALYEQLKMKATSETSNHPKAKFELPYDLQFMILERFSYRDTPGLLSAFGWQMPDTCWIQRLSRLEHTVFELNDGTNSESSSLDLQSACLISEELSAASRASLEACCKIWEDPRAINGIFLQRMADRHQNPGDDSVADDHMDAPMAKTNQLMTFNSRIMPAVLLVSSPSITTLALDAHQLE